MIQVHRKAAPLRVLQVLHGLARAGAEQLVYELAAANRDRMITEIVCLDNEGPLADELRALDVRIHHTGRREGIDVSQVRKIAAVVRAFRPHVVHCHQYSPFLYGALGSLVAGRGAVLFTEHGRHYPDVVGFKRHAFNRFLCRKARHVTAVCRFTLEHLVRLEGIPANQIEIVYNGVDADRFDTGLDPAAAKRRLDLPDDAVVVMQVGTFRYVKDQATAVKAMRHVRDKGGRAILVFVGDGPDRPSCERLAQSLDLGDSVRFLGQRGDMPHVLAAADIMLMTSLSEAHSVSLLEGMASGLPVVGTRVGGIPETVAECETGLLAPKQDPPAIAEALRKLVDDTDLRRRMGQAGAKRVRDLFRRSDMHRRYMEIYRRLAQGRPPRP